MNALAQLRLRHRRRVVRQAARRVVGAPAERVVASRILRGDGRGTTDRLNRPTRTQPLFTRTPPLVWFMR
jgi:Arc/MetJ family transcription regulator